MGRSASPPFVRAVKRAFADALLAEIHRCQLPRDEVAAKGGVSRGYLFCLLRADRLASIGTLISMAEGLGVRPEHLLGRLMDNLSRIRASAVPPNDASP
jgi:transcriptional regulator with XRE-family HTH domain